MTVVSLNNRAPKELTDRKAEMMHQFGALIDKLITEAGEELGDLTFAAVVIGSGPTCSHSQATLCASEETFKHSPAYIAYAAEKIRELND